MNSGSFFMHERISSITDAQVQLIWTVFFREPPLNVADIWVFRCACKKARKTLVSDLQDIDNRIDILSYFKTHATSVGQMDKMGAQFPKRVLVSKKELEVIVYTYASGSQTCVVTNLCKNREYRWIWRTKTGNVIDMPRNLRIWDNRVLDFMSDFVLKIRSNRIVSVSQIN